MSNHNFYQIEITTYFPKDGFFLLFLYTTVKLIMPFRVGVYEKDTEGGSLGIISLMLLQPSK